MSDVVQVARKGHHYKHRRYHRRGRVYGRHHHYRHPPRGWHRYHSRPYGWRERGCIVIGPLWYCR
jgi:hypothetical protein